MAETAKYPVETKLGCGIIGGIFPSRRNFWQRKTSSVPSLPTNNTNITIKVPAATTHNSKNRRRGSSSETAFLESSNFVKTLPKPSEATRTSTSSNRLRRELRGFSPELNGMITPKTSEARRMSTSSSSAADLNNRLRKEVSGISTEMYGMIINDHPQQSNGSGALIRSTSNNVMLLGHLGNLRAQFPPGPNSGLTHRIGNSNGNGKLGGNGTMGNIVRKVAAGNENQRTGSWYGGSMMNRILDPEVLKCMGNKEYKVGRFEEALGLYNKAIALDSSKASYHSNKGAALTGLGRLIEAVFECREAIRIEPHYHRAHHRLATLYLRLGEAEKALCHYKYSCPKPDSEYIAQAQALQTHLSRCTEAHKLRDWNTLLKETQCAMSSGADSAPEIYAWQAEALLKLHRHQEAYFTFRNGPNFDLDACTQIFGPARTCYLLIIRAQLYLAMGRFEDAIAMAQHAARLDSCNKEVSAVSRRIRVVASARLRGNQLFKASKFSEACVVYCEGLEHDPYNSLLLCNRAACRSKLGQFEKAVEDCTAALDVRPSYSKARLRRADCNAKLERWEASIQDYEMLKRESPGDEEVSRALFMAQIQLKKQRGEDVKDMKFGSNLFSVSSNERFRFFVTSPGMSVVLFCNKTSHEQAFQLLEQICKRFPSVNFLKVEVEDHPYLAKSEGVSSIPAFKIYKNGSRVKEISGNNRELLESSVKLYSN